MRGVESPTPNPLSMIFILWNCQGIENRETIWVLKNIVSVHHPDVLVLLELRINGDNKDRVCKNLKIED